MLTFWCPLIWFACHNSSVEWHHFQACPSCSTVIDAFILMDLNQLNSITNLHRLTSVEEIVKFVRLCAEKKLTIDFILKDELDIFIKPSNTSASWVRQQVDGVRVKAIDRSGCTIYAIWMRESLMKDYVAYLESMKKTLSEASVFSFPVIWWVLILVLGKCDFLIDCFVLLVDSCFFYWFVALS